jgi:internalin A
LKQGDLAGEEDIKSIAGIEKLTNLKGLNLRGQKIEDLSPLEELSGIKYLDVANNEIVSLDIITKLDKLMYLDVSNNNLDISDSSKSMQIIKDLRDRGVTVKY